MYQIKTDAFEGPLELLLDLIEKQKLSINTVSLAAIADAYVTEVKARSAIAPDEVANFLVVASTLMLIKSRSLLPQLPLTDEEEQSIQELEHRLQQLRRMRELSRHVAELAQAGNRMHERVASYELPVLFYPPNGVTPAVLGERMASLIRALPIHASFARLPEKAVRQIISLEDKIKELMERVEKTVSHSFKTLVGSVKEKSEIIVSFLALLELVKQGHVSATQQNSFDDIVISKKNNFQ